MILTHVDHYRVVEPMVEGLRIILNYRGEPYSPAYIQGVAGAAFHIGGICPCAPTCTPGTDPLMLAQLLGFQAEQMPLMVEGKPWNQPIPDELLFTMIERVRDAIRQDKPVLVWNAFTTAEWDVVAGYDDDRKKFFGRGSYKGLDGYAEASWTQPRECLDTCPALGAIFIGDKVANFDAKQAEIDSLKAAILHAHSQNNAEKTGGSKWVFLEGFLAYQRWVNDFKNPEKVRDMGDAYCYGVYRTTHRAAADYLSEIAPNHPMILDTLYAASRSFKAEADALGQAESLLCWSSPVGPDAERNRLASTLLDQAYGYYQRGIEAIEEAVGKLA